LTNSVRNILHEYSTFELELGSPFPINRLLVLILFFLRVHLFAAQQDHLEEIDFVLWSD